MRGIVVIRVLTLVLWLLTIYRGVHCRPQQIYTDSYALATANTYQTPLRNQQQIRHALSIPFNTFPSSGSQFEMNEGQIVPQNDQYPAQTREINHNSPINQFQPVYHENEQRRVVQAQTQNQHGPVRRQPQPTIGPRIQVPGRMQSTTVATRPQSVPPRTQTSYTNSQVIVFPDQHNRETSPLSFVPRIREDMLPCPPKDMYCDSVPFYPTELVKQALAVDTRKFAEFFSEDQLPIVTDDTIRYRHPDSGPETEVCASTVMVVYPKVGKNKDDKWMYIVNQETFAQGVRVEKCVKEEECLGGGYLGYNTTCKQKYILRKMVALDDSGKKATTEYFKLPSCCACYTNTNLLGDRMTPTTKKPNNR